MKKMMTIALGAMTMSMAGQALAQVNVRQINQERRIDAGKRSGKLTNAEAARLKAEQRRINILSSQLRARHGGKLTRADKRLIHARQEAANRHILMQKHDAQRGRNHLKVKL